MEGVISALLATLLGNQLQKLEKYNQRTQEGTDMLYSPEAKAKAAESRVPRPRGSNKQENRSLSCLSKPKLLGAVKVWLVRK